MRQIDLLEDYCNDFYTEGLNEWSDKWYNKYVNDCKAKGKTPMTKKKWLAVSIGAGTATGLALGAGGSYMVEKAANKMAKNNIHTNVKIRRVKNLDMQTLSDMAHKKLGK